MTVQKTTSKSVYKGDGVTTIFPVTFELSKNDYVHVYVRKGVDAISETKNFSINNKNVIYPASGEALAEGDTLVITRELPFLQQMNLVNQGPFYAEDIEQAFDEVTMMIQQLDEKAGRALVVEIDSTRNPNDVIDEIFTARNLTQELANQASANAAASLQSEQNAKASETISSQNKAATDENRRSVESAKNQVDGLLSEVIAHEATTLGYKNNAMASAAQASEYEESARANAASANGSASLAAAKASDAQNAANEAREYLDLIEGSSTYVTPKMFGAKGDGVTDDTLALQETINYAIANNIPIVDGAGKTYLVSDIVSIPSEHASVTEHGIYIKGNLIFQNCKLFVKANSPLYTTALHIIPPIGATVRVLNVSIDGNRLNQTAKGGSQDQGLHGIRINKYSQNEEDGLWHGGSVIIENCYIDNCYTDGIAIVPCKYDDVIIRNTIVKGAGRNGITDNAYSSLIDGCTLVDNGTRTSPKMDYHIEPDGAYNFGEKLMRNCKVGKFKIHFNSNPFNLEKLSVNNCTIESVAWANYSTTQCTHNVVEFLNCDINSVQRTLDGSNVLTVLKNISFRNCRLKGLILHGCSVYDNANCTRVVFDGCTFSNLIYLYANYKSVDIKNCKYIRTPFSTSDRVADSFIYWNYSTSATIPKKIGTFNFDNNYIYGCNRVLEIQNATNADNSIDIVKYTNNIVYSRSTPLRLYPITKNLIFSGNTVYNKVSYSSSRALTMNNTQNIIIKSNMFSFPETKAFAYAETADTIISDNMFEVDLGDVTEAVVTSEE